MKVPDGKLVRVEVDYGEKIQNVDITGDFFLEPPESLERLEEALEGLKTGSNKDFMVEKLEEVDAELIGFSREDLAEAVEEAVR